MGTFTPETETFTDEDETSKVENDEAETPARGRRSLSPKN